jgi:hypothetical protein
VVQKVQTVGVPRALLNVRRSEKWSDGVME